MHQYYEKVKLLGGALTFTPCRSIGKHRDFEAGESHATTRRNILQKRKKKQQAAAIVCRNANRFPLINPHTRTPLALPVKCQRPAAAQSEAPAGAPQHSAALLL